MLRQSSSICCSHKQGQDSQKAENNKFTGLKIKNLMYKFSKLPRLADSWSSLDKFIMVYEEGVSIQEEAFFLNRNTDNQHTRPFLDLRIKVSLGISSRATRKICEAVIYKYYQKNSYCQEKLSHSSFLKFALTSKILQL